MRTRTTKTNSKAAPKADTATDATTSRCSALAAASANPPQVFVLPDVASSDPDARILTLPHPASSIPARFLISPAVLERNGQDGSLGFYEFTRIAAPRKAPGRSWLLAPDRRRRRSDQVGSQEKPAADTSIKTSKIEVENDETDDPANGTPAVSNQQAAANDALHSDDADTDKDGGYVLQTPDLLIATPFDPLFLLLPSLSAGLKSSTSTAQEFLAASDHVAALTSSSSHFRSLLLKLSDEQAAGVRRALASRLRSVCDCMEMGEDESDHIYALSMKKLALELFKKAKKMAEGGLPPSMEENFVRRQLEIPVSAATQVDEEAENAAEERKRTAGQTEQSAETGVVPAAKAVSSIDPEVLHLQRVRTALTFVQSALVPPHLVPLLKPILSNAKMTMVDFTPLNAHLSLIAARKKEHLALRSLSDNISRKRSVPEGEDEDHEGKEDKKRRKKEAEEEERKKKASVGLRKLAKADTSGMKKLSSFFGKKS